MVAEEKLAKQLEHVGILKRFQNVTFDSIKRNGIPASVKQNYNICLHYSQHIAENIKNGRGMILAGGIGTMKTTLAIAILRDWIDKGNGGIMVRMCSLIDNLFTMRERNRDEWLQYEERMRKAPIVVIDDLGTENTDSKWVLGKVESIIMDRYDRMLPVILTTNLNQSELAGTYSGRLLDRLKNSSYYLSFEGDSNRQTVLEM